ncbi:MAG: hypothetical protein AM325_012155 [Candidatus Thorarchaeota archaeon SMTZ1-45]|nr:MAG: hypothetical protein AM325_13840 [Candidatus Thorarchaeota archaeon SMTZ1-45]
MGDVILVYDEYGRTHYKRLFWMNVVLYVILGIIVIVGLVDLIIIVVVAFSIAMLSLIYALYFIRKNPPLNYEQEV